MGKKRVLYVGGFELPDKNAAAQRVVGIAKGLRDLDFEVMFLNALKGTAELADSHKDYFGFETIEYKREGERDYLFSASTVLERIKSVSPSIIIAYNYPSVALSKIIKYAHSNGIRVIADVTEWSFPVGGSIAYQLIKRMDTSYRMRIVHKRTDGVIAVSRFLYDYYKNSVRTVIIPPTVDFTDSKWSGAKQEHEGTIFVYAGSPSSLKERLDIVVDAIEKLETKHKVRLDVVGITEEQYAQMYRVNRPISDRVFFRGRVSHEEALRAVKEADWSIIIRENNRVVKAGFPTKVVESISCGTPVIANIFSNIEDYLNDDNSVLVYDLNEIRIVLDKAIDKQIEINSWQFDYHNYQKHLYKVLE